MADGWHGLLPRVISGVVMAGIALVAVYGGPAVFAVAVAAAAAVLAWEWTRLCGGGRFGWTGAVLAVAVVALVVATSFDSPLIGLLLLAIVAVAGDYLVARSSGRVHPRWIAAGTLYIGLPCIALVWLREQDAGRVLTLWLLLTVAATDIGAYFTGRLIGGPKLAPRISPNKTWAGLIGGMACAALVGWLLALYDAPTPAPGWLACFGAIAAVIAQIGDFLESWIKRRFSVKDASSLIPGHGGLFDRLDGMMAAACALAVWHWSTAGAWLTWR